MKKILFMGSAQFAVPSLVALAESSHELLEVVTQPDKPAGRGMHLTACPVAQTARSLKLPLHQPKSVKTPEAIAHFRNLNPDMIVVVAYGKILPPDLLAIPKFGSINVHASLLPKYRGAAPINWAIVNGERETGVTTQLINDELDAGDILLSAATQIDEVETADALYDRLAPLGAEILMKTIEGMENGSIRPRPQDRSAATFAPIIKKEDGHIDWSKPARAIANMVRGFKPWPGTFTTLEGKVLRVHEVAAIDNDSGLTPGSVIEGSDNFAIACGEGTLYLLEVQMEGKRRISAVDFLRGHKIQKGVVLA